MIKKRFLGLVIGALLISFVIWDHYRGTSQFPKEMKKVHFGGVFVRSYQDHSRKGTTTIVWDDSTKQDFDPYYNVLPYIQPGDTLIKPGNILKLIVKHVSEENVYYPSFFGDTFMTAHFSRI